MRARSDAEPSEIERSWVGTALWRLAAVGAFALSLLCIKYGLLGAVFLLLTAIFCLPGAGARFRPRSEPRMPGVISAVGAALLAVVGVVSSGMNWQVEQRAALALERLATGSQRLESAQRRGDAANGALIDIDSRAARSNGGQRVAIREP